MSQRKLLLAFALCLLCSRAGAALLNVAAGASVTLNGEYGVLTNLCCGWDPAAPLAAGSTLVDELLLPQASVWNVDTVWWDTTNPGSANNSIEINLGGFHLLQGFLVQADDNDSYRLEVRDSGNNWITVWEIPAVGGFGMQARPNPSDPTDVFLLGSGILGDRLRFTATSGDGFFSVSEVEAFVVPEPRLATLLLTALALVTASLLLRGSRKP